VAGFEGFYFCPYCGLKLDETSTESIMPSPAAAGDLMNSITWHLPAVPAIGERGISQ
jgi:hypothetical protein